MAAIGHGLAIFIYAFAAATSLSYLITNHANIFLALQLVGALMLLWLGWTLLKSSWTSSDQSQPSNNERKAVKGMAGGFSTGFIIAALNPKTAAFFVSLFSQFLDQDQSFSTHMGMAILAGFIDIGAYVIYVIAFTTSMLGQWIDRTKHILERLLGALLLFLGFSLITSYFI